jgi:tetratricopeptide (TPR) repeat protein
MDASAKEISKLLQQAIDAADTNDTESARKLYARCLALDGESRGSAPSGPGVRCRAWLNAVDFRLEHGDPRDALGLARRAAERWSNIAMVHSMLGRCYLELDQFVEAERAYRRANAIRPCAATLSLLAESLRRQGREDESTSCLHEALKLDPNYEEAHYNIGCALRFDGRYEEAIEHFERAVELDPDYACAHAELGHALLAQVRRAMGEVPRSVGERALRHLRRSVELDPNYYWSRIYLALYSWQLECLRQARTHYAAAVRLEPEDGFVLSLYADFLSAEYGPTADVEARFRRAIRLAPEDANVRFYYGKHLLRAARYTEARAELLLADRLGHRRALEVLHAAE